MKSKTRDAIDNQGTDRAPDNVGEKKSKDGDDDFNLHDHTINMRKS
jgi:hypothetical protein